MPSHQRALRPLFIVAPTDKRLAEEQGVAMQVTIRVQPEVALMLHRQQPGTDRSEELLRTAEDLGVILEPLHPGAQDPLLTPYFVVEVPDQNTAERVIADLQRSAAVEAAYLKPPDESP